MSKLESLLTEFQKSNPFSFFSASTGAPQPLNPPRGTKSRRSSASSKARKSGTSTRESSLDQDGKPKRRSTISTPPRDRAGEKIGEGTTSARELAEGGTEVMAVVLHGPRNLRIERQILPPPSENEVRIRIACTTLCGSDLHYYTSFRNGSIHAQHPFILGHESCGYITALGSGGGGNGVLRPSSRASGPGGRSSHDALQIGDLVAIEPGIPCSSCSLCLSGRYNLCQSMHFRSSAKSVPHADGTLRTEINHPASHVFKLPSNMPVELGALIEPLAVALHAHTRAKLSAGATILVLGGGAIGLLVAAVGRSRGLRVVVADLLEDRVRFATRHGFADKGVVVPSLPAAKNMDEKLEASRELAEQIKGAHLPGGLAGSAPNAGSERVGEVDACFECTGSESALQSAIYATRPGGKVLMIGMGNGMQTLPIAAAATREVDLLGVFRYAGTYADAVGLAGSGDPILPDLQRLVTHQIRGAEKIEDAFKLLGTEGCIKAAFYWN